MKKFISAILLLILCLGTAGCKSEKSEQSQSGSQENFDIKIAANILDSYMKVIQSGDEKSAEKFYGDELAKNKITSSNTDLKIQGYKTEEINEVGKSGVFKVKVVKSVSNKPLTLLDDYNIKIESVKNEYKITNIESNNNKEAFVEDNAIRLRSKNEVKNNLVMDLGGLPKYAYPSEDMAKLNKVLVPKDRFGMMCFDYSGEKIAITTNAGDNYLGVIKIDESMSQSGQGGSSGGGGSAGGSSGSSGGSAVNIKEPPIGKEIVSLDIIKNSSIDLMNFSLEEKSIVVQFKNSSKATAIRLYDADTGEISDYDFEKNFSSDKFDVLFSSFDKEVLNFEVKDRGNAGKGNADKIGKWQLSLKEMKAKKI
ncbi:hypothetical protein IAI10_08735 [Clostridium sp. 19966]|uniref:hypothetical protein n=1 Tax=Clostridium sp. 19966 TaxID=2768166 RepID=UPI0028DE08E1|nr:hypothetical protein [Clostridium sp. 19966]MDT8716742.1 hypothetical protein [Clostridium sp. 19966]